MSSDEISRSPATPTPAQQTEIRALVDQLALEDGPATGKLIYSPGVDDKSEEYAARYAKCQDAFKQLKAYKRLAFPILVEHLGDKRQSIPFRAKTRDSSVGNACYTLIYFQLRDFPADYSEYGYSRAGRDGQQHPKPYWSGTPFDEAGGLAPWLEANQSLSYVEMQIKFLDWHLQREKQIGAPDADSYFLNVLPLEIRILERRQQMAEAVDDELARLRRRLKNRVAEEVPAELLPAR